MKILQVATYIFSQAQLPTSIGFHWQRFVEPILLLLRPIRLRHRGVPTTRIAGFCSSTRPHFP
jgi:hypothetical protein